MTVNRILCRTRAEFSILTKRRTWLIHTHFRCDCDTLLHLISQDSHQAIADFCRLHWTASVFASETQSADHKRTAVIIAIIDPAKIRSLLYRVSIASSPTLHHLFSTVRRPPSFKFPNSTANRDSKSGSLSILIVYAPITSRPL